MSHHINKHERFISDKYKVVRLKDGTDCSEDKLVLSFNDLDAHFAIEVFAFSIKDRELREDILEVLNNK